MYSFDQAYSKFIQAQRYYVKHHLEEILCKLSVFREAERARGVDHKQSPGHGPCELISPAHNSIFGMYFTDTSLWTHHYAVGEEKIIVSLNAHILDV